MSFLPNDIEIAPQPRPRIKEKTLGDIGAIVEAQRLYNPQMPSVAKGPTAGQADIGVAGKLDTAGSWGKPSG